MANRAALFRAENAGKPVTKRGRNFIEFDLGNGVTRHVASVDPIHYGAAHDQEIDTTWVASVNPAWQLQLLENNFQVHARDYIDAGSAVEWYDTRSGESVTIQPLALNWVDNLTDSRQQISIPQHVQATSNDETLLWTDAYGSGRHFSYTAHPRRLIKRVIIDNASYLPAPTVSNPYLEIEFIIDPSKGLDLYVDGQPWDKSTKVATVDRVEFRLSDGTVTWYFDYPIAQDSSQEPNTTPGIFQLRKQGGNLMATVRVPKAWVDSAVFPIALDPTFVDGYGGDVTTYKDNYIYTANQTHNNGASISIGYNNTCKSLLEFDLSSIDSAATCNSATLYLYHGSQGTDSAFTWTAYSIAVGNDGWPEGNKNGATGGAGDSCFDHYEQSPGSETNWAGSPGLATSGTDYEASSLGSFNGNRSDAVGTEYSTTLTAARIEGWFGASNTNYGLLGTFSAAAFDIASSDHATTGYRPKLVVDYSAESASASASASASPSATLSPSASPSATLSPSASPSATLSPSASASASASASPSATLSPSASASASISPSASGSASLSPSASPSPSPAEMEVVWGHDTGVLEDVILDFNGNWTGTGNIENPGVNDTERLALQAGESMTSNLVHTGVTSVLIAINVYQAGDAVLIEYRHGATPAACLAAGWANYVGPVDSLGYLQVRLTSTL